MEASDDFPAFQFGGICVRSLEGNFHSTCLFVVFF